MASQTQPQAAALLYHNVGLFRPGTYRGLTVEPEVFGRQMQALVQRGFTGISAGQWVAAQRGNPLPAKPVIITFDDGYADLCRHAFPVLERLAFSATVFVVTNLIGGDDLWLRKEDKAPQALLTKEQIQEWSARGIEFGAHSRTHADLTGVSQAQMEDEIAGSRRALELLLQQPVACFAYPYGFYDERVLSGVRREFAAAFTTENGLNDASTDPYRLRRSMVAPTDGPTAVYWRAARGDYPIQRIRAKMARIRNRISRPTS